MQIRKGTIGYMLAHEQFPVHELREIGISPDVLVCRTEKPLGPEMRAKLSMFCSVPKE